MFKKEFFLKFEFEKKNSRRQQKHEIILPRVQRVNFFFRSFECAESVLEEQISDCGASITQTAMSSWHDTRSIAEKVCKPMVPPPVPSPMPMPEPIECVPADYYDPMGGCNIGLALSCIAKLKGHVFDMAGTESGFCL